MSASTLLTGRKRRMEEDDETREEVEFVEADGGGGEDGGGEREGWSDGSDLADGEDEELEDLLTTRTPKSETDEWAGKNLYEVEAIEAQRWHKKVALYLVHWEGLPRKADTWEPTQHFKGNGASVLTAFLEKQVR
jgi:hypothetical protein